MDLPPMTLEDAQNLYNKSAYVHQVDPKKSSDAKTYVDAINANKNVAAKARSESILDTALKIGVRAGLSWQLSNIEKAIKKNERELDTIYDFSYLMIRDRIVPPVITEARDIYTQEGSYKLRLSGAYYKIESQARFSSTPPSWRDYLNFPPAKFDKTILISALLPNNAEEKRIWKVAVADGWKQGVEQANIMLQYGLDRMNRDLLGMLRFHTFVRQGKISMPIISIASIPINKEGDVMTVDETLLRITTLPDFNIKQSDWQSSITSSPLADPTIKMAAPPVTPPASMTQKPQQKIQIELINEANAQEVTEKNTSPNTSKNNTAKTADKKNVNSMIMVDIIPQKNMREINRNISHNATRKESTE